jgi:signal transduction histidine kinase/HAMP domain-containing protein
MNLLRSHSIGAKIFAAFFALGLMTVVLGGYGIYVLDAAGDIVADTYDGPLMEINFARSASLSFAQMENEVLQRKITPEAEWPAIDGKIDELSKTFFEDIGVAEQRSLGARERALIEQIRGDVSRWNELRRSPPTIRRDGELDTVSKQIIDGFDTLIELTADQSFIQRRKAVSAISSFRYVSIALSGLAVSVGIIITFLLVRSMVKPLMAASKVADRIADGQLQTPIPLGGKDEIGALLRSMTVMQDNIRETMQHEVAQRQSAQRRLIDALESSREGMVLVDAAGKIVIANSQVADFFPSIAADIIGGNDFTATFSSVRPLLDQRKNPSDAAEPPRMDAPFWTGEHRLLDGRWVRFSRSDTRDGGFFLFLIDFTEIKEREEHFKIAKQQAEAANTAKSHFLANMSHELRTPLNAIIGFSEMISGQMFGSIGNPQYVEYAGDVLLSAKHLLEIINDVLDLAKNEAGRLEIKPQAFDLNDVIHDCSLMIREQCERAKLRFDVTSPEDPLPVWGEPAKIRQIALNLLSNAMKFNAPGGQVSLSARMAEGGMTEFCVADTGIGMSSEDIAVALTPFGQVDSSLARRYEGTGLGLPLTKTMVELHGGVMTIDSKPGCGTCITVSIPSHNGGDESNPSEKTANSGKLPAWPIS